MANLTLNSMAYELLSIAQGGEIPDDTSIDLREIKEWIHQQRALWLKRELDKPFRPTSPNVEQDLGCVQLEIADNSECCTVSSNCDIVRTKLTLPKPFQLSHGLAITRVGSVDKMYRDYNFIPYEQSKWFGNSRFNGNEVAAFYLNERIYLISKNDTIKLFANVNIRGIFEDPTSVAKFTTCSGQSCYSDDDTYPINRHMWNYMKTEILKANIFPLKKVPQDLTNDNKNEAI